MSESSYKKIDRAVYQVERALVVGSLVVMAVVVFLDVVHRSFSSEESKFALVAAKLAGMMGLPIAPDSASYQQLVLAAPYVLFVVFTGLAYFGIRTANRVRVVTPLPALIWATGGVVVTYGLVRLLIVMLPAGLIWSQPLALVLTLWVGFVGASMCTYENRHLKVEAVQRVLPQKLRPLVGFVSGVVTTLVCLALLWVSTRYVLFNYEEYVQTEGKGGLFKGMDVPKYLGFAALPVAFGFMAIRFGVKALGALRGEFPAALDAVEAAGGGSLSDSEDESGPESEQPSPLAPSEVPTEVHVTSSPVKPPSDIDTMTSKPAMPRIAIPRPQSKVPTDAHPFNDEGERISGLDVDTTREIDGPPAFDDETIDLDGPLVPAPEEESR